MIYEKSAGAKCSHQSFSPRCVPLLSLVQALGYFSYIYETVTCEYFRPSPPRTSGWGPSILGWCWSTPPLKTWPAWLLCGTIWRRLWSFTWRYNKHVFWFKYNLLRVWSNKAPLSLRWIPVSLAVTALFQAVMLDSTDVNMWYKIGQVPCSWCASRWRGMPSRRAFTATRTTGPAWTTSSQCCTRSATTPVSLVGPTRSLKRNVWKETQGDDVAVTFLHFDTKTRVTRNSFSCT